MMRRSQLAIATAALTLLAGTALADAGHSHRGDGPPGMGSGQDMTEMMTRMHPQMMGGGGMSGMGGGHDMQAMMARMHAGMMGGGAMGGKGMMGGGGLGMILVLDANGDGEITADEARAVLEGLLGEYDANADGALSLDEFETLHSALIRETVVDRFQHLDADGDGQVTGGEMTAPADRIERMDAMRSRMMQGQAPQQGQMTPGAGGMMDSDGQGMMQGN